MVAPGPKGMGSSPPARPAVIQELSSFLVTLLRTQLRESERSDPFPVYWGHPRDLDEHPDLAGVSPLVALGLLEVLPDPRVRSGSVYAEAPEPLAEDASMSVAVRRAPLWITCRYVLSVRSDDPVEEQSLVAAAVRLLHESPHVPADSFGSLEGDGARVAVEAFPISMRRDDGLWSRMGLRRHALLIPFEVTVPLPSRRVETLPRVVERVVELDVEVPSGTTQRGALSPGAAARDRSARGGAP